MGISDKKFKTVYIGLGTNLGDREKNLSHAIAMLGDCDDLTVETCSSILNTPPVDYTHQPDFLNQVIRIKTLHSPKKLLSIVKGIEKDMGRETVIEKGPRIIDLDILLYEGVVMDTENLTIPHKEIKKRDFVLQHLVDASGVVILPGGWGGV